MSIAIYHHSLSKFGFGARLLRNAELLESKRGGIAKVFTVIAPSASSFLARELLLGSLALEVQRRREQV